MFYVYNVAGRLAKRNIYKICEEAYRAIMKNKPKVLIKNEHRRTIH